MKVNLQERVEFAHQIIREAGEITSKYFGTKVNVDDKKDGSPVTEADRASETHLRKRLQEKYPEDGIMGEEFGKTEGKSGLNWYLDPIDGTQSFVCRAPFFSNMIALESEGESLLGVVHFPMINETIHAARGLGTWWKEFNKTQFKQIYVTETTKLKDARISTSNFNYFKLAKREKLFSEISNHVKFMHSWADSFGILMVATGRIDAMLDPIMYPWDTMPFKVIVEEARGVWTDFDGKSDVFSPNAFSTNKHLHPQILDIIKR